MVGKSSGTKQKWFQLHLSTLIIMSIGAGLFIWANTRPCTWYRDANKQTAVRSGAGASFYVVQYPGWPIPGPVTEQGFYFYNYQPHWDLSERPIWDERANLFNDERDLRWPLARVWMLNAIIGILTLGLLAFFMERCIASKVFQTRRKWYQFSQANLLIASLLMAGIIAMNVIPADSQIGWFSREYKPFAHRQVRGWPHNCHWSYSGGTPMEKSIWDYGERQEFLNIWKYNKELLGYDINLDQVIWEWDWWALAKNLIFLFCAIVGINIIFNLSVDAMNRKGFSKVENGKRD